MPGQESHRPLPERRGAGPGYRELSFSRLRGRDHLRVVAGSACPSYAIDVDAQRDMAGCRSVWSNHRYISVDQLASWRRKDGEDQPTFRIHFEKGGEGRKCIASGRRTCPGKQSQDCDRRSSRFRRGIDCGNGVFCEPRQRICSCDLSAASADTGSEVEGHFIITRQRQRFTGKERDDCGLFGEWKRGDTFYLQA